jgi:hypothetical protein
VTPLVLGIDPGSKFCGLCLVRGRDELVSWGLSQRPEGQNVKDWVEECRKHVASLHWTASLAWEAAPVIVAVEAVIKPQSHMNGKLRMNSPESLIGTAAVMGGMIVWAATEGFPCVLVAPGGNGSGRREGYPPELWGAREGPAGTGKLGHVRSAWDVALAGRTIIARLSTPPRRTT